MKLTTRLMFLCIIFMALSSTTSQAQDRFLAYTAQSNVLPKGTRAVEIWYANKSGGEAYFNGNYMRTGFKMGFGKNFIAGYYLNMASEAFVENGIDPIDQKTRIFDNAVTQKTDFSFSAYAKMKFLDPVANPIGLAAEMELTIGSNYFIYSPKLIIDKRFGNNYLAFNTWVAVHETKSIETTNTTPSNKTGPTVTSVSEPQYEFDLAYLHFMPKQNIAFGFEARTHSESTTKAGLEHIVLFAGPAVHFRGDKWFFNLSAMPQVHNFHTSWIAPDALVLDEHQKFELRTMLGFIF
jgi:hypothetical protein